MAWMSGNEQSGETSVASRHTDAGPFPDDESSNLDEHRLLPDAGRLVWVTPEGTRRELSPLALRSGDESTETRRCPDCAETRSIETLVREHRACGHVRLDGFLTEDDTFVCPKCGATDPDGRAFGVVATVYTCVGCGTTVGGSFGHGSSADR